MRFFIVLLIFMDYPVCYYHFHVPFNSLFTLTQLYVNFETV